MMAAVREGRQSVLSVVDAQVGVMSGAWDAGRIAATVARAVDRTRAQRVPVLWVQHSDPELPRGSPGWHWVPEPAPVDGEPLIHKQVNSAFEETALDQERARVGATHIALAGAATNRCIRATAYAALGRGYDLTLIEDAHTTEGADLGHGTRIEARALIEELNAWITGVRYPGRRSGTATADQVDFAAPGAKAAGG